MQELPVINGKVYPMWSQFIEKKDQWIGGILHDHECESTKIKDIRLEPNGTESAVFIIEGEDYTCSFDVKHGGVGSPQIYSKGLGFSTSFGISFDICKKEEV